MPRSMEDRRSIPGVEDLLNDGGDDWGGHHLTTAGGVPRSGPSSCCLEFMQPASILVHGK
ncbi:hypothetical protein SORBI_3006G099650 [Sorghum bicolor]|uniref:Uncharacterized protein n=1 Tax=Sorghum bicolor TaxID=4558 RepID=A0A1Z5RDK3_SORBI|nr:hypothetical protein SORBI_3006G099650 [Sorghum bicolor]